ncbi:MAG: TraR/DksA C4-type zinc finger protein [Planctomycetes bacterium]|nr:TraR/DksA C4-type zinc finger protein [Planctomycetota bacterium]
MADKSKSKPVKGPKAVPRKAAVVKPAKARAVPRRPVLPPADLTAIKRLLLAKRKILTGDVSHMKDVALDRSGQEAVALDASNFADLGSDNYEQEFTIGLIENEAGELLEIEAALERIEAGTYGACEACSKPIPKPRLMTLPFARLCIACKRKEESGEHPGAAPGEEVE